MMLSLFLPPAPAVCLLFLDYATRQILKILDARQFRKVFQSKLDQELLRCAVHHRAANGLFPALCDDQFLVQKGFD